MNADLSTRTTQGLTMSKYRIKIIEHDSGETDYYVQYKFGWFWPSLFKEYSSGGLASWPMKFDSYDIAYKKLVNYVKYNNTTVSYKHFTEQQLLEETSNDYKN